VATATAEELTAGYDGIDPGEPAQLYGAAWGIARGTVGELLAIIDDLTGGAR
jgi:hypothetical protein